MLLSEASLLGLQMAPFSLAFLLASICGSLPRFPLPSVRLGQDPLQRPRIDPAYKDLSKCHVLRGVLGLRLEHEFGGRP